MRLPPKMPPYRAPDVVVPGSVAVVLTEMVPSPDLVTMKGNRPTLVAKPTNPALAFSKVVSVPAPSPTVTPRIVFATEPKQPPGMEPTVYPRAPIESSKGGVQQRRWEEQGELVEDLLEEIE